MAVKAELKKLGLHYVIVNFGEIEIMEQISTGQREQFKIALQKSGLELMDGKRAILIEKIKAVIVEMIHHSDVPIKINFSNFLTEKIGHDYRYLSSLFSEVEGTTIEHYIIAHKIERVTEISYLLNYSSVAHLSNQFKKVTGLTPTHFKKLKVKRLKGLEEI